MQTLAKLPTISPTRNENVSKTGERRKSRQSGRARITSQGMLGEATRGVKARAGSRMRPPMDETTRGPAEAPRGMRTGPLLVGTAVVVLFVGFLLAATDAHFVPKVLDLYVVCQYAKAMAEGHPFQYNPGEPPSTGSTSVLHTAILAVAWRLGAHGEALVAFATLLGAGLFLASIVVGGPCGRRLTGGWADALPPAVRQTGAA